MQATPLYRSLSIFFSKLQKKASSLLVAVSGGADSVALVYLLHEHADQLGIKSIAIAHVNHGLRGSDSDADEQLVKKLAGSLGSQFFTTKLSGLSLESSALEEVARHERYAFFQELKKTHGFDYIATAHTADDQAETVIQRLVRGSGLNGLRAIHAVRDDSVIRPLLCITKQELIAYLVQNSYSWREDLSNNDPKFMRNYIRHKVLPSLTGLEPAAVRRIASVASDAARVWSIVEPQIEKWLKSNCSTESDCCFEIKKSGLSDAAVASEALRALYQKNAIRCDSDHIEMVFDKQNCSSGQFLLPDTWSFYPLRESILFAKGTIKPPVFSITLKKTGVTEINEMKLRIHVAEIDDCRIETGKDCVCIDFSAVSGALVYRAVQKTDAFVPFGQKNTVNVLSFLAKQGYSKVERERTAVIADSQNGIVWIPGIRISECCRVSSTTKRAIKISIQPHADII